MCVCNIQKDTGTYIIIFFKVGLFDLHTLSCRVIGQNLDNDLFICAWRKYSRTDLKD